MPEIIAAPTQIPVPGGKSIEEYVGCASNQDEEADYGTITARPSILPEARSS